MEMRECRECGKDIPAKMEDSYDNEYNYQLYYCNLCKDCYGDYGSRPFFIGIDDEEDNRLHPLLNPIIDYFEDKGSLREGVYGTKDKKIYHAYYGSQTTIIDLTEIDRILKIGYDAIRRHKILTEKDVEEVETNWEKSSGWEEL